jgi:transcription antitermination factor NusG
MAHAYTPGLKVTEYTTIIRRRLLPIKGEVIVSKGDRVKPDDVVARTFLPGPVAPLNVANILGILPEDVPSCMIKKTGDKVKKGETIAISKSFFGLFKSYARSKQDGFIENISNVTGQVMIRGEPMPVEVKAYLEGEVEELIPEEGVVIKTNAAFVQGIFGIGGETHGILTMACSKADERLEQDKVLPDHKGEIIVGGSFVNYEAIKKAVSIGVRGIVVGGIDDRDLRRFMGYDLGVAITGSEELGITLIITEGFGEIKMAQKTFELLKRHQGKEVCINGATQIRAGVIRPEVIIPLDKKTSLAKEGKKITMSGLEVGSPVRVIRQPYFGKLGVVTSLPPSLQRLESGAKARVVEVKLEQGEKIVLPRANVELIEVS